MYGNGLIDFATRAGYPIIADPLSNVRAYGRQSDVVITAYDADSIYKIPVMLHK